VTTASTGDIVFRDARQLVALVARRELSAVEVLDAHLQQIERPDACLDLLREFLTRHKLKA